MKVTENFVEDIKKIIVNSVGGDIKVQDLTMEFKLVGNLLDSMSVNNLIIGLEDNFGILFDDDELSEEMFQSVGSLINSMEKKIGQQ
jgi:acyl carrier protein